jgi:hypothetical protein
MSAGLPLKCQFDGNLKGQALITGQWCESSNYALCGTLHTCMLARWPI